MTVIAKTTYALPNLSLSTQRFEASSAFAKPVLLAQFAPALPATPVIPLTGFEAGGGHKNTLKSSKIHYTPKNPVPVGVVLTDAEIRVQISDRNFTFAFNDTLKEWLHSSRNSAAAPDLKILVQNHVKEYAAKSKRAERRDRGRQREAVAATGGGMPPFKKPKKNKSERKKQAQPEQVIKNFTPNTGAGNWRIINGVKTYAGPELPAPQRPTTMPNSTRINAVEPPAKWTTDVKGVKVEIKPHTTTPPASKPQIKPEPSLETQFWRVVNYIKILGR